MRADICDPADDAAVQRFQSVLQDLGAGRSGNSGSLGVDVYRLNIGGEELTIFSDTWSIDIEGPDDLVRQVLNAYNGHAA